MKTLYESIIANTGLGIKTLLITAITKLRDPYCTGEATEMLKKLWKKMCLDIPNYSWFHYEQYGHQQLMYAPKDCAHVNGAIVIIYANFLNDILVNASNNIEIVISSRKGLDLKIHDLYSDRAKKETKDATKDFTQSFLKKYDAKIQKAFNLDSNKEKGNDYFINTYKINI